MASPHSSPPRLSDLASHYPDLWKETARELHDLIAETVKGGKGDWAAAGAAHAVRLEHRARAMKGPPGETAAIKARMVQLALRQFGMAALLGQAGGKIRFNTWNGLLLQAVLFEKALVRKPVSGLVWRLTWPLVTQKKILMPLMFRRGIYCFYGRTFVKRLAKLLGPGPCLEIAAGDGTLSRFLRDEGIHIRATDDFSWTAGKDPVIPALGVEKIEARQALREVKPTTVLCSWPPAGNPFEKAVFETDSVTTYVVVGSVLPFASGDRAAYEGAPSKGFTARSEKALARGLYPVELGHEVRVFRRG